MITTRRRLLVALPLVASLASCGFQLRRAPEFQFKTIQLSGFRPRAPLADELRASINASTTTKVVEGGAQVVLEALEDVRERVVVASSSDGKVTELQLRARFTFRLRNAAGRELIGATTIPQSRDLSYAESAALGKEQEEAFLHRSMQTEIVAQVMRRLASVQSI